MRNIQWKKLIISILIPLLAGYIGSIFTSKNIPLWYTSLIKPSFNPPSWVFAPVWTMLYIMMGIALYLIWKQNKERDVQFEINLFYFQLVLNVAWSIIFFGFKQMDAAFIEIIVLWISILLCIIYFYRISRTASFLMIPYLLWVSFASILNYSLWQLNS